MSASKLIAQEARYLISLDYLPLDFRDLRQALTKNGYELIVVRNLPPPPSRILFSGEIARKKETVVFADSAGQIGVVGRTLEEAQMSFNDLIKLIAEEIGIDLHKRAKNYEVSVHYRLNSGKMPLKEIPNAENKEFVGKVSEIMGENLSSFSIRLAKKDSSINQGDWIDIAIEPDLVYENYYHIGAVYRNSHREKTETFVKDLETNLLKLIELIEA